jgi:nucleoside-diphosphate-sugar epimerase
MSAILVTGGCGFVGLNVVEQLAARGEDVVVFDVKAPPASFGARATFLQGDVSDRAQIDGVFARHAFARVIHLAAITAGPERDRREPRRIAEVNFLGTLNVLEAARDRNVRRFVHASTGALYGAAGLAAEPLDEERDRPVPESMYGITKYAAERSVLRLGSLWNLDVRIGRLAMAYGKWEYATGARDRLSPPTELTRIARRGGEAVMPRLGPGDHIYAPDLARAIVLLLDAPASTPNRLYHLGNGEAFALPDWCRALAARYPAFRWRESERIEECNVTTLSPVMRTRFSNRRLVEELGYAPRFPLAQAVADFADWLEAHPDFH